MVFLFLYPNDFKIGWTDNFNIVTLPIITFWMATSHHPFYTTKPKTQIDPIHCFQSILILKRKATSTSLYDVE